MPLEPAAVRLNKMALQLAKVQGELTETQHRLQAISNGGEGRSIDRKSGGFDGAECDDSPNDLQMSPTVLLALVGISVLLLVFGFFGGVLVMRAKFKNRFSEHLL